MHTNIKTRDNILSLVKTKTNFQQWPFRGRLLAVRTCAHWHLTYISHPIHHLHDCRAFVYHNKLPAHWFPFMYAALKMRGFLQCTRTRIYILIYMHGVANILINLLREVSFVWLIVFVVLCLRFLFRLKTIVLWYKFWNSVICDISIKKQQPHVANMDFLFLFLIADLEHCLKDNTPKTCTSLEVTTVV